AACGPVTPSGIHERNVFRRRAVPIARSHEPPTPGVAVPGSHDDLASGFRHRGKARQKIERIVDVLDDIDCDDGVVSRGQALQIVKVGSNDRDAFGTGEASRSRLHFNSKPTLSWKNRVVEKRSVETPDIQ